MLIGLNGKKRSGKNTVADFMLEWAEEYNFPARQEAFADKLKLSAASAFGLPTEEAMFFCEDLKESGIITVASNEYHFEITGREFLQWYGTEAHRQLFDDRFWISQCLPEELDHKDELVIITDVRFSNEAEAIKIADGDMIRVVRADNETDDAHASEQPLSDDLIDIELLNDSNLQNLRWAARTAVERLYAQWLS